jgi:hypothetical protein
MTQRILLKWDGKSTAVDFHDTPIGITTEGLMGHPNVALSQRIAVLDGTWA